ncbi:hypothetical protein N9J26_00540 [bacterium]|nr:hypothetical protein [bacterium]
MDSNTQSSTEEAVRFGVDAHLVGILSKPAVLDSDKPCMILISAGLIHKTGPHRMHTLISRALVTQGFAVFRFDLNGVGDSRRSLSEFDVNERSLSDIVSAMDFLAEQGIKTFILGGLCSGAEDSFQAAYRDSRVVGVFLLDPHGYKTWGYHYRDFWFKVRRKIKWWLWGDAFNKDQSTRQSEALDELVAFRETLPREGNLSILNNLVQRKVRVHYIYTGGVVGYFNYQQQFYRMFPKLEPSQYIQVSYYPELDHTAIIEKDRNKLIDLLKEWLAEHFSTNS